MSTILFQSPVFGPVHSRRLGVSLGVNLLPGDCKVCDFDCIYCECGYNKDGRGGKGHQNLPSRQEVVSALRQKLEEMRREGVLPDVITFAGNGEPTLSPVFPEVIGDTIALRDEFCPKAKIAVLSNATMAHKPEVFDALMRVDDNILKLDTVDNAYIRLLDRPVSPSYDVKRVVETLKKFNGHVIVQTMFLKGKMEGKDVDNTSEEFVKPWLEAVKDIAPMQVMIYTIDRETPDHDLEKASPETLNAIRDRVKALGIDCTASY